MRSNDPLIDHLFRRAGFGANATDLAMVSGLSYDAAVDFFLDYEKQPDDVDSRIGSPEFVSVTTRGQFSPNTNIEDARQREVVVGATTRGAITYTYPAIMNAGSYRPNSSRISPAPKAAQAAPS